MDKFSNNIVSFDSEPLILVNSDDQEIGYKSKSDCHDGQGLLHRAFSLFIFNDNGELLLQQRAKQKRLWPLYWSNSCCSHPRQGETMDTAIVRRLEQELGIHCALEFIYKFQYQAQFDENGAENELCSVYLGKSTQPVKANTTEIESWRFVSDNELENELIKHPEQFTPWFKMEWQTLNQDFSQHLKKYI